MPGESDRVLTHLFDNSVSPLGRLDRKWGQKMEEKPYYCLERLALAAGASGTASFS